MFSELRKPRDVYLRKVWGARGEGRWARFRAGFRRARFFAFFCVFSRVSRILARDTFCRYRYCLQFLKDVFDVRLVQELLEAKCGVELQSAGQAWVRRVDVVWIVAWSCGGVCLLFPRSFRCSVAP